MKVSCLSFNEKESNYEEENCAKVIKYLAKEKPSILVLFTQNSVGGNKHFQHVCKDPLEKAGYSLFDKQNSSNRNIDSSTNISNLLNKGKLSRLKIRLYFLNNEFNKSNITIIKEVYPVAIKGNPLLFLKIHVNNDANIKKFIFINCYTPNSDILEYLNSIIETFKLSELKEEYTIFLGGYFSGNFNFLNINGENSTSICHNNSCIVSLDTLFNRLKLNCYTIYFS
jgi:hypothetical protein